MAQLTTKQAQGIFDALHLMLKNWKQSQKKFLETYQLDKNNQAANAMAKIIEACINEVESAISNTTPPADHHAELIGQLRQLIEIHDAK